MGFGTGFIACAFAIAFFGWLAVYWLKHIMTHEDRSHEFGKEIMEVFMNIKSNFWNHTTEEYTFVLLGLAIFSFIFGFFIGKIFN